jgi:hypothetical protein
MSGTSSTRGTPEKLNYRILVGKPQAKIPLGKPKHRWEDIEMDAGKLGRESVEWILLAQDGV